MLWGAESEKILDQESEAAQNLSIPKIFGATDEDTDGLRIVSLYEVGASLVMCFFSCNDVCMIYSREALHTYTDERYHGACAG